MSVHRCSSDICKSPWPVQAWCRLQSYKVQTHILVRSWPKLSFLFCNFLRSPLSSTGVLCVLFSQESKILHVILSRFSSYGFLGLDQWVDIFRRPISVAGKGDLSWYIHPKVWKAGAIKSAWKGLWHRPYSALTSYLTLGRVFHLCKVGFPNLHRGHLPVTTSEARSRGWVTDWWPFGINEW